MLKKRNNRGLDNGLVFVELTMPKFAGLAPHGMTVNFKLKLRHYFLRNIVQVVGGLAVMAPPSPIITDTNFPTVIVYHPKYSLV
jgi:hypothetical protein